MRAGAYSVAVDLRRALYNEHGYLGRQPEPDPLHESHRARQEDAALVLRDQHHVLVAPRDLRQRARARRRRRRDLVPAEREVLQDGDGPEERRAPSVLERHDGRREESERRDRTVSGEHRG